MKITKKDLRKTALKLLPAVYNTAMQTGEESGLFQHDDWRTGLCLDAFLLAEAFEKAAAYRNTEPEPQLKQLDQSVFKNMHERWRFAAISADGSAYRFNKLVDVFRGEFVYEGDDSKEFKFSLIGKGYDASNWQNSLIERDVAKELTGSELCKAMLERGDKWVVCFVAYNEKNINYCDEPSIVVAHDENGFYVRDSYYSCAVPVNRKGEPLTASEAGL